MKCIIVVATSQDGFITKGNDPHPSTWASEEDQEFFADIKSKHKLFVMGSTTYESNDIKPTSEVLRVILTSNPEKFAVSEIPKQLEFATLSPQEFVKKYEKDYESCLVLGGSFVYTEFLEAGVIDEVYLTIEPVLHGQGVPFLGKGHRLSDFNFAVVEETPLNEKGSVLKHYVLKK